MLSTASCNPYERTGEYYAGPVDGRDFPRAYRGVGATANSSGEFEPLPAFVGGAKVGYFAFPVPAGAKPTTIACAKVPPRAYVFDPGASSPFPQPALCVPPANYTFDPDLDFVRYDEQGNVFTALPSRTLDPNTNVEKFSYTPVVSEVTVISNGEPCQDIKSEKTLVNRRDVDLMLGTDKSGAPIGVPSGRYLAWAVIDPTADVFFLDRVQDPKTALGPQKWGWFNHFLLAYIDGGYLPTDAVCSKDPAVTTPTEVHVKEQVLYVPDVVLDPTTNMPVDNDGPGSGADVLEFKRSDPGYSPLCRVKIFTQADPMKPVTDAVTAAAAVATDTMTYVYCLQPESQTP